MTGAADARPDRAVTTQISSSQNRDEDGGSSRDGDDLRPTLSLDRARMTHREAKAIASLLSAGEA